MSDLSNLGKKAETKIREWLDRPEEGYCLDRIRDQMTGWYGSSNICDFTLFKAPNFYYIESKSTYADNFPISMLTDYQYSNMLKKACIEGVYSIVIVLFASYKRAFAINIKTIEQLKLAGIKSFNIKKIDKWMFHYCEISTISSKKELLDYNDDIEKIKEVISSWELLEYTK